MYFILVCTFLGFPCNKTGLPNINECLLTYNTTTFVHILKGGFLHHLATISKGGDETIKLSDEGTTEITAKEYTKLQSHCIPEMRLCHQAELDDISCSLYGDKIV